MGTEVRRRTSAEAVSRPRAAARRPERAAEERFDRLVYERVRLGMLVALAASAELTFTEMKALFELSDGNLSAHARKLEDAGFISCVKTFADRRPRTSYRLTTRGRDALDRYLDHVESVIRATRAR
jgi:DNA-binding MarR family transcriptional regulator